MKTPIQEVLETYEVMLSLHSEMAVSVRSVVEDLKSHLEKEKEVMESAWQDGMYECDGDGTFENYYNETFNTNDVK